MTESVGTSLGERSGAPTPGARRAAREARAGRAAGVDSPSDPIADPTVGATGDEAAVASAAPATSTVDPAPDGVRTGRRSGERARRTAARERRRFWLITMPAVALALGVLVGVGALLRSRETDRGTARRGRGVPALERTASLIGHTAPDGSADLVLVVGRAGDRGSVLMLPTATQVEVPSLGIRTLAQVPAVGTDELLTTSVENLTGVRTGPPTLLDDARLTELIAPAAPLRVDLPREVTFVGETRPAFSSGPRRLDAAAAARVLTAAEPGSEVDRLVTVQAVLAAWMDRLRDPGVAARTLAVLDAARPLTAIARLGSPAFDTLPVDSIGTDADERLRVRASAMPALTARLFPGARLGIAGRRPRVEILNGVGRAGLAQAVSARVVPVGADVRLTSNTREFGVTETQVVYYRDADRAAAQAILDAVGVGSLRKARREVGITDVTILVGSDFAAQVP